MKSSAAKFEVAISNNLGGVNLQNKIHYLTFDLDPGSHEMHSTSYDPFRYKV